MDLPEAITALGDRIAALTPGDATLVADYLKEKYQIEAPKGGGGPIQRELPQAPPPPEEPTEFTVTLEGLADASKKINVIKVVRELTGCGLAEGKTLVESAPKPIKENVSKEEAETLKKKLEEAGAKVALK
jgi:large subunit ribosomal protein L7/L12